MCIKFAEYKRCEKCGVLIKIPVHPNNEETNSHVCRFDGVATYLGKKKKGKQQ